MHCVECGLAPVDLPSGTPADLIFETCEDCGEQFCQGCLYEHEAIAS